MGNGQWKGKAGLTCVDSNSRLCGRGHLGGELAFQRNKGLAKDASTMQLGALNVLIDSNSRHCGRGAS